MLTKKRIRKSPLAVAKDVLKHLKSIKKVAVGDYLCIRNLPKKLDENTHVNAQPHINIISKNCNVCALGACMLSFVRLYNKVSVEELDDSYNVEDIIRKKLAGVFSGDQLNLIEAAFEIELMFADTLPKGEDAVAFGRKYEDDTKRLKAIMENIVKNHGKFIPLKVKEETYKDSSRYDWSM